MLANAARKPVLRIAVAALGLAAVSAGVIYYGASLPLHVDIGAVEQIVLRLVLAAVVFGALLYATRVLQSVLTRSVLTPERIDRGIAYSIEKAVGYTGLGLAGVYAASLAGLDLTGLTLVAGALTVGVGFGLQNVISNFVCGLIVLIERPIKVGDWVVVKDREGIVKRIDVRATEIETFDKASVLIPNSEFITGTVLNWTHGSPVGQVIIKIKTSPSADPDQIVKLLADTASRHPAVLAQPAPWASFDGFDSSALTFSLGVHVSDIGKGGGVRSSLLSAILAELRKQRIALAAPAAANSAAA